VQLLRRGWPEPRLSCQTEDRGYCDNCCAIGEVERAGFLRAIISSALRLSTLAWAVRELTPLAALDLQQDSLCVQIPVVQRSHEDGPLIRLVHN
jgi:hypothetical protein